MTKKGVESDLGSNTALRYFLMIFLFFGFILTVTIAVLYNLEANDYLKQRKLEEKVGLKLQQNLIKSSFETIVSDVLFLSKQNELLHLINHDEKKYKAWMANEYLEFSNQKRLYDQIRYLDESGMEVVRVNFNNGNPEIVEQSQLQPKGNRYYFKDTFALGPNEIFVSPLDLNIEKGEIEKPLKPMIRFGVPIFNKNNKKCGIILFNYLGSKLIASIKEVGKLSPGDIMLINSDGYWLSNPNKDDEWGFMIKERSNRKFSLSFPDAWNKILSSDSCQIYNNNGLFTSVTIYPLKAGLKSSSGSALAYGVSEKQIKSSEYFWKLVSYIPTQHLSSGMKSLLIKLFLMAGSLFLFASIPSWIIAKAIVKRKSHQIELKRYWNHLENLVKERTEDLIKAKDAAEAASKAKSDFLANISHELRTPLNGIIVSAELALGQELPSKAEKNLQTIHRSGRSLLNTVTAILDFSKSESGKPELAAIPFRLDEVLQKLSGTFIQKGAETQIEISFDIAADKVSNALIGDPDRLMDVLSHLLDNAAKFSTGTPKAVIGLKDVGPSAEKTTLEFSVKDNGIGIASEDFEKIFDAFTQVDATSTRQYDGTGMGLAVSKRLVERMGGTIWVESELGKGSTFYFTASFDRQDQEHPFKVPAFKDREDTTAKQTSSKISGEMGSPESLLELLLKIDPFIQKRKPKPCKEVMAEINGYSWPNEYAQDIAELDRLIGKYKFKDAQPILESIVEKLKSNIS